MDKKNIKIRNCLNMTPKFIAHRGNIQGPNPHFENNIDSIRHALMHGFGVEVDLRCEYLAYYRGNNFYLSHDKNFTAEITPTINIKSLDNENILVHCKDNESYNYLMSNFSEYYYLDFFKQEDEMEVKTFRGKRLFHQNNTENWDKNTVLVWLGDFRSFRDKIGYKITCNICPSPCSIITDFPESFTRCWNDSNSWNGMVLPPLEYRV